MITIDEDKENINYIRIRKLLQKDDFLYNKNNKISNETYKKKHYITINSKVRENVLIDSTINY